MAEVLVNAVALGVVIGCVCYVAFVIVRYRRREQTRRASFSVDTARLSKEAAQARSTQDPS